MCILTVMELQNSREHKCVQYFSFHEKLNVVLFNHLLKMVIASRLLLLCKSLKLIWPVVLLIILQYSKCYIARVV